MNTCGMILVLCLSLTSVGYAEEPLTDSEKDLMVMSAVQGMNIGRAGSGYPRLTDKTMTELMFSLSKWIAPCTTRQCAADILLQFETVVRTKRGI